MQVLNHQACKSFLFNSLPPLDASMLPSKCLGRSTYHKPEPSKSLFWFKSSSSCRNTHVVFCSQDDNLNDFSGTQLPEKLGTDRIPENGEFGLLNKPHPAPVVPNGSAAEETDKEKALEPFLKFFKPRYSEEGEAEEVGGENDVFEGVSEGENEVEESNQICVQYYEPKPGDLVVGVVVSGNENKLDVNVGADLLGTMLTKEVLPLYDREMDYLVCDLKTGAEGLLGPGKMGIVKDENAMSGMAQPGRPVVETGTVLFAEVLGRTLGGRPLLSTRCFFRRIAWHRLRQIKQMNEPIEVYFTEWNTGGLLTRIEGIRAFLPKAELMKRINNFSELKEYVGQRKYVQITQINEATNDLILSEREAWEIMNLKEGTLLKGTVKKVLPYGAQIRIGETNRSGLLHISNMSKHRITSVDELLKEGEQVKVLVTKSLFPDKISLRVKKMSLSRPLVPVYGATESLDANNNIANMFCSTANLESEPGLFISDKQRVFSEAEEMAKKYRQKFSAIAAPRKVEAPSGDTLPLNDEPSLYANWKWFKFEQEDVSSSASES